MMNNAQIENTEVRYSSDRLVNFENLLELYGLHDKTVTERCNKMFGTVAKCSFWAMAVDTHILLDKGIKNLYYQSNQRFFHNNDLEDCTLRLNRYLDILGRQAVALNSESYKQINKHFILKKLTKIIDKVPTMYDRAEIKMLAECIETEFNIRCETPLHEVKWNDLVERGEIPLQEQMAS